MSDNAKPVWFVTGCSTGFGRQLASQLLSLGYRAVITARKPEEITDLVTGFEDLALILPLDVTKPTEVDAAIDAAIARFGRIDVLVNNAGIGYFGSFEESDMEAVHRMFDINVWGLVDLTRKVLPHMRKQRSGTIVNLSSIGGIQAYSALSFYNATKFAVEALSEALQQEVAPLGIKVLIVEPSGFRTDWAGRSAEQSPNSIVDYDQSVGSRIEGLRAYSGNQAGDPEQAAKAIIMAVEHPETPLRLLLGKAALSDARRKLEHMKSDFDAWAEVTEAADFPTT
jgi:NAD(P)-dependent dehydrogenase (short-subunit alcohol dehydrogenase family)